MSDAREDVLIHRAKTEEEARVVRAVLGSAGIPCGPASSPRWDEFAATQRAMNMENVEIRVPADRAEEARKVLRESREAGEALGTMDDSD